MNYFDDQTCKEKRDALNAAKEIEKNWQAPKPEREEARQAMTEIGAWFGERQRAFIGMAQRAFPVNSAERMSKLANIIGEGHTVLYQMYYEGQQQTFTTMMFITLDNLSKSLANQVAKAMQKELDQ